MLGCANSTLLETGISYVYSMCIHYLARPFHKYPSIWNLISLWSSWPGRYSFCRFVIIVVIRWRYAAWDTNAHWRWFYYWASRFWWATDPFGFVWVASLSWHWRFISYVCRWHYLYSFIFAACIWLSFGLNTNGDSTRSFVDRRWSVVISISITLEGQSIDQQSPEKV